jgi:Uma2 family endonuclease
MTIAAENRPSVQNQPRMTLEEFLRYDNGTDTRYELVDGVLVAMGAESRINLLIAIFLIQYFPLLRLTVDRLGIKERVQVRSQYVTAHDPDLIIHSQESSAALEGRAESCVLLSDPNPLIVIEVVSPGDETKQNYKRDYEEKPNEYANRGIPEFWRIDPEREWVQIGILTSGEYQFRTFQGHQAIVSPALPELTLTAVQVLTAGRSIVSPM